jgi:hypothetical protein
MQQADRESAVRTFEVEVVTAATGTSDWVAFPSTNGVSHRDFSDVTAGACVTKGQVHELSSRRCGQLVEACPLAGLQQLLGLTTADIWHLRQAP